MPRVVISSLASPSTGYANQPVTIDFSGHVEEPTTNPAIAIQYLSGPVETITVVSGGTKHVLERGSNRVFAGWARGEQPACTYLTFPPPLQLVFPAAGTYELKFIAGYLSDGALIPTDEAVVRIVIRAGKPPASPSKPPKLPSEVKEVVPPAIAAALAGLATWKATGSPAAGLGVGIGTALVVYGLERVMGW